jgi:hypothetical protein
VKRNDWSSRLFGVIEDHRRRQFAWGTADCGLFAARCYDAMTGSEFEQQLLTEYAEEGPQRLLLQNGMVELVNQYLGPSQDGRAVRGDVVLVDGGDGQALGICMGSKVVALGANGLHYLSRDDITAVWHVESR